MRENEAPKYLKIIKVTLISKSQDNEICDFLAHRNVSPLPRGKPDRREGKSDRTGGGEIDL